MSLLRILAAFPEPPLLCRWVLIDAGRAPVIGETTLAELPKIAQRIELVIPAADVLITRAQLPPPTSGSRSASLLAYAIENEMASEADGNQVSWMGAVDGSDVVAVLDREALRLWRAALADVGIHAYAVCVETLMLPMAADTWSLAWNGHEGFVRTGQFEGVATDRGDVSSPPLSLLMLLDDARLRDAAPAAIALYLTAADASPDLPAWQHSLGVELLPGQAWDWRSAMPAAGINLMPQHRRWRLPGGIAARLRPAAWMLGTALAIHGVALVVEWTLLANEHRTLQQQMETRFRETFPEAVAVADPALQMRRKLAEARHAVNLADDGDFAPMMSRVSTALKDLPSPVLRRISYMDGRMQLEMAALPQGRAQQLPVRMLQSGLIATIEPNAAGVAQDSITLAVHSP